MTVGVIPLDSHVSIQVADGGADSESPVFAVQTASRTFELRARSKADRLQWTSVLSLLLAERPQQQRGVSAMLLFLLYSVYSCLVLCFALFYTYCLYACLTRYVCNCGFSALLATYCIDRDDGLRWGLFRRRFLL